MFLIPAEGDNAGLVVTVFDRETLGPARVIGQVRKSNNMSQTLQYPGGSNQGIAGENGGKTWLAPRLSGSEGVTPPIPFL